MIFAHTRMSSFAIEACKNAVTSIAFSVPTADVTIYQYSSRVLCGKSRSVVCRRGYHIPRTWITEILEALVKYTPLGSSRMRMIGQLDSLID